MLSVPRLYREPHGLLNGRLRLLLPSPCRVLPPLFRCLLGDALFADRTLLPILKDAGEWLVVSVNGATGWILKTAADVVPAE